MNKDKIVFMSVPKDEIQKSYEQNTSKIITPKSSLITETNIPTLKKVITVNFIRTNNDKVCVEVEESDHFNAGSEASRYKRNTC